MINNDEELVDAVSNPKSDPSSDTKVDTYTNTKNPQKLLRSRFVPKISQGEIGPIEQFLTEDVPGIQETLGVLQKVIPKDIVKDTALSCACIYGLRGR